MQLIILFIVLLEIMLFILAGVLSVFFVVPLFFYGAPFLPSYRRRNPTVQIHLQNIISFVKSKLPDGKFIDLGSGDGRVVIEFARRGFDSWGVEFNPALVLWSRLVIKRLGLKNAHIIKKNFWKMDLSSFDIVYIYQLTSVNALLSDKFKKELKPGALIISAGFFLPNLELIKKEGIFGVYKN